jgi:hypothetical protein
MAAVARRSASDTGSLVRRTGELSGHLQRDVGDDAYGVVWSILRRTAARAIDWE